MELFHSSLHKDAFSVSPELDAMVHPKGIDVHVAFTKRVKSGKLHPEVKTNG